MEFYINPDDREKCEKKLSRLFKGFNQKPKVTYSEVQKVIKTEATVYYGGDSDDNGISINHYKIDAIKVTIEDFQMNEWRLVASVFYREGFVTICDKELFKSIPSQYGLEYKKCDHCGGNHGSRKESHILYNTEQNKWMQVGSSCVSKLIPDGKYLATIAVKLHEVFEIYIGGCDEEEWHSGGWMPKSHFSQMAIPFKTALMAAKQYRGEDPANKKWAKPQYERGVKVVNGTNDNLINYYAKHKDIQIDAKFINTIFAYLGTLEAGVDYDGNPDFNAKMKNAVDDEFVAISEMYLAFFAIKGYEDSLTQKDFEGILENLKIEKGQKYDFVGELVEIEAVEATYWYTGEDTIQLVAVLKDSSNGLTFKKDISHRDVLSPYKDENDIYHFTCTIKYIAYKNRYIGFGGRCSKTKTQKPKK